MSEQPSSNLSNDDVICRIMLFGTYIVVLALSFLLLIGICPGIHEISHKLQLCLGALVYVISIHLLLRWNYNHIVARLLVLFYALIATSIVLKWGINAPIAPLIIGLVIVLAGILLTARHAFIIALISGMSLLLLQTAITYNWYVPIVSSARSSSFHDVLGYATIFGMLGLISWLYNRQMERSLLKAKQAERALLQQKATLKSQVKKRTQELRQSQLEEMQQLYRFAELGQLGVTLLHELANHLTALTLEIEGLDSKEHSRAIKRARKIITYLDNVVESTRERLHHGPQKQTFDVIKQINDAVMFLKHKANDAGVIIEWQPPKQAWKYIGNSTGLCQVIAILTNNAIDAYQGTEKTTTTKPRVRISAEQTDSQIIIYISDWGKGIKETARKQLFKPFQSTKRSGLGLGLFIASQIITVQFSGSLTLSPATDHTEFIIKLPRK